MRKLLIAGGLCVVAGAALAQALTGPNPIGAISGLATGVATWLATPSSANLAAALTDETGSGKVVFDTSPTFTTGLTVNTGADNTVKVCQNASQTTYNMLSLNGSCADATGMGLLAGATADANIYLNTKASSSFIYRVASASAFGWTSAGVLNIGTIGDIKDQNFVVSTSALNKTDTNFATVTGLSISLTGGKSYACKGHLTVTAAPAGGGIKVALNTSDTLTVTSMSVTAANYNGVTTNARSTATALNTAVGGATATATDIDIDAGIVVNAAGTLVVQAAQNAASGTTTVGPNSTFWCKRVS